MVPDSCCAAADAKNTKEEATAEVEAEVEAEAEASSEDEQSAPMVGAASHYVVYSSVPRSVQRRTAHRACVAEYRECPCRVA